MASGIRKVTKNKGLKSAGTPLFLSLYNAMGAAERLIAEKYALRLVA
jgi:hypothetical protein